MAWNIIKYSPESAGRWDDFVRASRNGTFLFLRGYMDYHADRFRDCSWMAFKDSRLMALLPADISADGTLRSHGGLTYGGWVLPTAHLDGADLLSLFQASVGVWREAAIKRLDYKPLPYIYTRQPSQEDLYALFRLGARPTEYNLSATIDLRNPVVFNTLQRRHLKKTSSLAIEVVETCDINAFMQMLEVCLRERHDVAPVHTAAEVRLLQSRFPDNIKFFFTLLDGEPQAGVCIYDTGLVAHAQYIATTPRGRELNLLTPLFSHLILERYRDRRYFDFGISNENHGLLLNEGLLRQKYSYGATGTVYSRYSLDLTSDLSTRIE